MPTLSSPTVSTATSFPLTARSVCWRSIFLPFSRCGFRCRRTLPEVADQFDDRRNRGDAPTDVGQRRVEELLLRVHEPERAKAGGDAQRDLDGAPDALTLLDLPFGDLVGVLRGANEAAKAFVHDLKAAVEDD